MAAKRLSFLALTATLTGAFGLWFTAGSIAASAADRHAPRIGVLPSIWWLAGAVLAAVALAMAARRARPVAPLLLAAIAALPWLPFAVPSAFLAWTGPLCIWLWVAVVAAIVLPSIRANTPIAWRRLVSDPRRAPALAAALAAVVYLAAAWAVSPRLPAGDEPHYLVITQSLLLDHDLKIENNHRQGDYHAYYGGDLRPDYLQRGKDREIYSIHAPGLSIAVAPAFALLGYPGVVAFLCLLSAAATGVMWRAVWQTTGEASASWFGWACIALSVPFFSQSFIAYPDALGAAIVMVGVATMIGGTGVTDRRLFATGAGLAALPWLHTRFAIAATVLAVLILARNGHGDRYIRRAAAFLTVPIVSAVAWFGFFFAIYGTADPRAPYGGYTQSAVANLAHGIPGLLFDQQFGLLPNAPAYLCVLAGAWVVARRAPRLALELAALTIPYALAVAAFFMWWGGFSSPARFLTPIVLPLAIPAGVWFQSTGRGGRVLGLSALLLSVTISATLVSVDRGALLYNGRDGASNLLVWLSPAINLAGGLPSMFQAGAARALVIAAIWAGAVWAVVACTLAAARRRAPMALAVGASGALGAMAALTIAWRVNGAAPLAPERGAQAVLATYDAHARQTALTLSPFVRLPIVSLLQRLTVADVQPRTIPSDEPLIILRGVPSAAYEIEATLAAPTSGHLSVTVDRDFGALWRWSLAGGPGTIRRVILLPVMVRSAIIDVEPEARAAIDRLVVRPIQGNSFDDRLATGTAEHVKRYGPAIVFLLDGNVFPEGPGAWVAGKSTATFVVSRDERVPLRLFVRTPPVANHILLERAGWSRELMLQPGEGRLVDIPIDPDRLAVKLRVTTSAGAKPTDFERGSTDRRFLGCWIEVR
jgi:hypothetical protein